MKLTGEVSHEIQNPQESRADQSNTLSWLASKSHCSFVHLYELMIYCPFFKLGIKIKLPRRAVTFTVTTLLHAEKKLNF